MESASTRDKIRKAIVYFILIVMAFIMLVPFAWMILTALKTNQEAISVDPFYIFRHLVKSGKATTLCSFIRTHCL